MCGDSFIRRFMNNTWNNLQVFDNTYVYNSIFFISNDTGWVVGSQGKIFKTVDATVWNPQSSISTVNLNDIFFINSLEGWIVGPGMILHTINGGITWSQEAASLAAGMNLRSIFFTSPAKVFFTFANLYWRGD